MVSRNSNIKLSYLLIGFILIMNLPTRKLLFVSNRGSLKFLKWKNADFQNSIDMNKTPDTLCTFLIRSFYSSPISLKKWFNEMATMSTKSEMTMNTSFRWPKQFLIMLTIRLAICYLLVNIIIWSSLSQLLTKNFLLTMEMDFLNVSG